MVTEITVWQCECCVLPLDLCTIYVVKPPQKLYYTTYTVSAALWGVTFPANEKPPPMIYVFTPPAQKEK